MDLIYLDPNAVELIYQDFQNAFGKALHERLLVKVLAHVIQGSAAQWIRNWLAGRRQRVCINQTNMSCTPVTSGVPQGSVVGPLIFPIYINDLDNGIVSKIFNFADDTKLFHSSRHPDEGLELQEDLNRLVDFANTWQMNFNVDKCAIMHIGHSSIQHNYTMANNLIATDEQCDLVITITTDLKHQKQTEKIC